MLAPSGTTDTVRSHDPEKVVPWVVRLRSTGPPRARRHCSFSFLPMSRCARSLRSDQTNQVGAEPQPSW